LVETAKEKEEKARRII
jgi:hypothetical protein